MYTYGIKGDVNKLSENIAMAEGHAMQLEEKQLFKKYEVENIPYVVLRD